MYQAYVLKLLKENPEFWVAHNRKYWYIKNFYIYRLVPHKSGGEKVEEVINYTRFVNILRSYFKYARTRIINGETFQLWNQIGSISARRVERNFSKKSIDFKATRERNEINPETGRLRPVYHTSPDWCRIGWNLPKSKKKTRKIRQYEFAPADGGGKGGFKDEFKKALTQTESLRYSYDYHPYINTAQ